MNSQKRLEILRRLREQNPSPASELRYRSPFELLVAVILSAQATDVSVNKCTGPLFAVAGTPEEMLQLGEAGLKEYIRSIGLFNTKARNIISTSSLLVQHHESRVPASREALESLPGVGRKTANVILNSAFGQPTIAVDTHVFRIANRINFAPGKDVIAVEKKLMQVVPGEFRQHAHHWLILHGRHVCTARKPRCGACVIADLCEFRDKQLPH